MTTSSNVGNDIVTQFIMSPYMKNLVNKTYVSNFDKIKVFYQFYDLLHDVIEDDADTVFWIYEDVNSEGKLDETYKWDILEPGKNEFYRTLSSLLFHFLTIRHQILEDIQNGEFKSVDPFILEIFVHYDKVNNCLSPNDTGGSLRDDENFFLNSSRIHRYAMDVLICYAMYYHIYEKEGSCKKFKRFSSGLFGGIKPFRVGTNNEYLKNINNAPYPNTILNAIGVTNMPIDGSIEKFEIKDETLKKLLNELYNNIDTRVDITKNNTLDFATKTAALVHVSKEIEHEIREIIKFNKPYSNDPSLRMMDIETYEEFQQAIIYNRLALKIYNFPGVSAFSVIMSGICGLLFGGILTVDVTINNLYQPDPFEVPPELEKSFENVKKSKNVIVGKMAKTVYNQLKDEALRKHMDIHTYINMLKTSPFMWTKLLQARINTLSTCWIAEDTANKMFDWFLDNMNEPGFKTYLEYEDRGRQTVGWLRPVFKCSNGLEDNKLKHILWMPDFFNSEVFGRGNCEFYSYVLKYIVDKPSLNLCSNKYKWLFVPFIQLREKNELHKMGTFFSPAVRLFSKDYMGIKSFSDKIYENDVNVLKEKHWSMKEPITLNTELDDFITAHDMFMTNKTLNDATPNIRIQSMELCVNHDLGLIKVYYNTILFNMLCRMLLKTSLGESRVDSVTLSQCIMSTSFKNSTDPVKLSGGYHARVLYKLEIDLSSLSEKFDKGLLEAETELNRQINDPSKNLKEHISEQGKYDLLAYAALYYIYVRGNELGLFSAYEKENAFSEKPFIDADGQLIPWINTNAPGCNFLIRPENKLLLDMYYISYYVFKFMKVKDIWCLCDINNDTLMSTPLIQDLLGLKVYHVYGVSCLIVLDNGYAINENYLRKLLMTKIQPNTLKQPIVVDTIRYLDVSKFNGKDIAPEVRLKVGTDWEEELKYDKNKAEILYQQIINKPDIVKEFHERMLNDTMDLETEFCKVMMKLNGNHMNTCFRTLHPYIFYFDETQTQKEYHLHPDITYLMDWWENNTSGRNYNDTPLYPIVPRMSLETNNEINPDFGNLSWTSIFLGGGKGVLDWIVKWIVIVLIIIVLVVILKIMNERRSLVIVPNIN